MREKENRNKNSGAEQLLELVQLVFSGLFSLLARQHKHIKTLHACTESTDLFNRPPNTENHLMTQSL
jgi:hypothetical protein